MQAFGRRASDFVKARVRRDERISLEYNQQWRDTYGRLLAFVWLDDGRMLNEVMICEGYVPALTRYPFRRDYQERFRALCATGPSGRKRLVGKRERCGEPRACATTGSTPLLVFALTCSPHSA